MKKLLAILLVPILLACMLSVPLSVKAADGDDIVQCRGWTIPDPYEYDYVYEIVLNPRYVYRGTDVTITDYRNKPLDVNYTVQHREVEGFGSCFVITVVSQNFGAYLRQNSFFDKEGNGNPQLYLEHSKYFTNESIVKIDDKFRMYNNVREQGTCINITFYESGSVAFGGKTLAENVKEYTLEYTGTGEQDIDLSFNGLTVFKCGIIVKTAEQLREERIAELEKELPEATKAFFKSLPLALVLLPLAPLAIFGFLWPFAPIEIGGNIIDMLSELWHLRSQR